MKSAPLALALLLLLAGCVTSGADLDAAADEARALEPLSEDVFALGAFLSAKVPSHDGVGIHIDVQLPDAEGPFPTLVQFTPYSSTLNPGTEAWGALRGLDQEQAFAFADTWVPRGYAVAVAHVRGSGQSGGCFDVGGPDDGLDGYALVEWIAEQEWSSGKVAMMGTSYVGTTPIVTATTNPPHLTTIVPVSAVPQWYRYYFENGEPRFFGELPLGVVYFDHPIWAATGVVPKPRAASAMDPAANAQCAAAQMENAWVQDDHNAYWKARDYVKDIGNTTVPILYAHGFLDENTPTSLVADFYEAYPAEKRMWLQQHGHGVPGSFEDYHEAVHRWLDHWLMGRDNGALDMPPVILQDDRGLYHVEAEWPPRNASWQMMHLAPGALLPEAPADGTASYTDEPRGLGEFPGPREGAVLSFECAPLDAPLHVTGAPVVELVAASDKTDTQWGLLLYDVAPDGTASFITRGYLDARHREDLARGQDLVPGEEALYRITMHGRDHHVEAGHTLRLVLTSSDAYVLPDAPGATNTVRFGPAGSRLLLPTIPGEGYLDAAPRFA